MSFKKLFLVSSVFFLALFFSVSAAKADAPITITTCADLEKIGDVAFPDFPANGDYILTGTVDCSATVTSHSGAGFIPIVAFEGTFDGQGNAYVSSIADGIGLVMTSSGSVNWNRIDSELDNGHPVIVSVYLPNVGVINADGSSHFVVISARSGNHYLMQDPLGSGRGYATGQVRSMNL